ncbi:MAG: hypothetical protein R3F56_01750 [Planctomycetota bacterium]
MKRVSRLALALTASLVAPSMPAQGTAQGTTRRTFVPSPGAVIRLRVAGIPELFADLPATRLGRMLADPDVAAAFAKGRARWQDLARQEAEVLAAGRKMNLVDLDTTSGAFVHQVDPHDLQRLDLLAYAQGEPPIPRTIAIVQTQPRGEGRVTRLFDDHVERMRACTDALPGGEATVDGVPVHSLTRREPKDRNMLPFVRPAPWFVHLPGTFVLGEGEIGSAGRMDEIAAPVAGATLELNLHTYLRLGVFGELPAEVATGLGLDEIQNLRWQLGFRDEEIVEDVEILLSGAARGFLAALVNGKGKLPAQPLPSGALLQVRLAIDIKALIEAIARVVISDMDSEPGRFVRDIGAAFDGSLALAVCAPKPGVIPRLYLTLGIADDEALDRVLAHLGSLGVAQKTGERDGMTYTALEIPGLPSLLQPTFVRRDGALHIAENGVSLRALVKALDAGGEAMDVGSAAPPDGDGEVVPGFDLRFDPGALYHAFHRHWLPLYTMAIAAEPSGAEPLVLASELPEPDVVAQHLRPLRGALRRGEHGFVLRQSGTLGGVFAHALAFAWPTMLSRNAGNRWQVERLQREIAKERLLALAPAFASFKQAQGRWPASLAELADSTQLDADALLIPGDDGTEEVVLPGTPARTLRTSFRYFPQPVKVDTIGQGACEVLLVAISPCRYQRRMLTVDGFVPDLWDDVCTRPIDSFGK